MELILEKKNKIEIEIFQKPIELLSKRNSFENILTQQIVNNLDSKLNCEIIEIKKNIKI